MRTRRFLLAAVGAVLSAPAYAGGPHCTAANVVAEESDVVAVAEEADVIAVVEAAIGAHPEQRPAKRAEKQGRAPRDMSVCEVTTANTKGPSYDAACLARLNQ